MGRTGAPAAARAALLAAAADLRAATPDQPLAALAGAARELALERLLAGGQSAVADTGALYEALLAIDVAPGPAGLVVRRSPEHRETGIYYTNPALVQYLLTQTLAPALATGRLPRLCDPACGSGAFLGAAAAMMRQAGHGPEHVAASLWGCDTDARALDHCRQALAAAGATNVPLAEADALLADPPGDFDLVVGNPPYIASGLRGAAAPDAERAARLRARFPEAAAYKLNTYPLFIQRGIQLLRPGGMLAFVLPDSLLMGKYFARLRRFILETCSIDELTLIRQDFWAHGRVGQTLLLILRREPDGARRAAGQVRVRLLASPEELAHSGTGSTVAQAAFAADALSRFRLVFTAADARFLARVEGCPSVRPLSDFLRPYSGLIARAGQSSLLRSTHADGRVVVRKAGQVLYDGVPAEAVWRPLLRSGAEVDRFAIAWRGERALVEPALLKSGGKRQLYEQPKLLLRQTADRLVCACDDSGLFCLNNLHLLSPRSGGVPELHYFAALLNSAVLNRYWRLVTLEEGRLYPQIDLDVLSLLPVPAPVPGTSITDQLIGISRHLHATVLQADKSPDLLARADELVAMLYQITGGTA